MWEILQIVFIGVFIGGVATLLDAHFTVTGKSYFAFLLNKIRVKVVNYLESGSLTEKGNTAELVYYKNGKKYCIIIPTVKGPKSRKIKSISLRNFYDDKLEFVTSDINTCNSRHFNEDIAQYIGPYGNFHGIPTTPKMLGLTESVVVHYKDDQLIEFDVDDVIDVNPSPVTEVVVHAWLSGTRAEKQEFRLNSNSTFAEVAANLNSKFGWDVKGIAFGEPIGPSKIRFFTPILQNHKGKPITVGEIKPSVSDGESMMCTMKNDSKFWC